MAGSLREIQAKIASTKKTSQITGAMQMVSASKLHVLSKLLKISKSMPQKLDRSQQIFYIQN